ncbi:MFS transporter [Nesterenkonia sandarakina]|uniref:Putative MFS family arabinose efflux permease n=1 Tax=Nesterenkonia sandarakina TaxID=272918 RepID=A0A7Z0E5V9_9MICC|nr:MFS transporter [Nesterenkonia sandarakina]NYJ15526.1 putative MFS family arabinose efflux permease [Nesterenkonia sandarakina]
MTAQSAHSRRLLIALFFIGVATFAQLYSPQGLLPLIAAEQDVSADRAALMISTATLGLALGVIPWSYIGDAYGRKKAMIAAISLACFFGLLAVLMPAVFANHGFELALAMRFIEGFMLGGVPALAVAYLNEEVSPKIAVAAAGTYISGTSLGGLTGRIVAAPVGEQLGWKIGMLTVTILAVACVVVFLRLAPTAENFTPRRVQVREILPALTGNLRSPTLWTLYLQGFLTMGGFVAMYNFLGFHLSAPPYSIPLGIASFVFLAYLAGTWSSPRAGRLAARYSRKPVLLAGNLIMILGVGLTLVPHLAVIIMGTVVLTAGFFAAHAVASGWVGAAATAGRAQSASLYNLGYYGGSSIFGYLGGTALHLAGWSGTVLMVLGLAGLATLLAAIVLPKD